MDIPKDFLYTKEHIWVNREGDRVKLGLTGYLQSDTGDILLVELPEIGKSIKTGDNFALIETAKAVVDLKSPVSGTVIEVNTDLEDDPDAIKDDPFGEGWFVVLRLDTGEGLDHLMDSKGYGEYLKKKDSG